MERLVLMVIFAFFWIANVDSYGQDLYPKKGKNDKWGYIDTTGKVVVPFKYDQAWNFSEELAMVRINFKWGFIDKTGKEVIPLIYDQAWDFSEGLARVHYNNGQGFIDKTGKEVTPFKYDPFITISTGYSNSPSIYCFSEGLIWVSQNGKYGFIDNTGKEVIPLMYESVTNFSEGLGRYEESLKLLKKAERLNFKDKNLYYNLAVVSILVDFTAPSLERERKINQYFETSKTMESNDLTFEAYIDYQAM